MALASPTIAVAGQNMRSQTTDNNTGVTNGNGGNGNGAFLPSGNYGGTVQNTSGALNYSPNGSTSPGAQSNAFNESNGGYSAGTQPGGNNYPAGIYGPGPNGSGTALGTVTQDELTSNQLNSLIGQNSPYIQQARNSAIAQANSRGALNSSIAAGNAQGAAIQAALPIATANANTIANLQTTNLNDLSKAQTSNIAARAQVTSAGMAAGAQMNVAAQNNAGALLRQTNDNAFQGEQNELNYERSSMLSNQSFQQTGQLAQQAYSNNLGLDAFNLGSALMTGQQNFYNQAGIAAMNDPAIMGDPASFGGYMQFVSGPFSNIIDSIFNNPAFGGMFGSTTGSTH